MPRRSSEETLACFLARQTFREWLRIVVRLQRGEQTIAKALQHGLGHQEIGHPNNLAFVCEPARARLRRRWIQTGPADQRCDAKTGLAALLHKCEDGRLGAGNSLGTVQSPKSLETRRRSDANARRKRIEHDPAANRHGWRVGAENESIAASQNGRRFETKPDVRRSAGRPLTQWGLLSTCRGDRHTTKQFRRALMEADARSMAQRSGLTEQLDDGVEPLRGLERPLGAQRVAAGEVSNLDTAQIDRHT